MQTIIRYIMVFILAFLLVFIFYSIMFSRKKVKNKEKNIAEVNLLIKRYKLDMRKIKYKNLLFTISIINSTIIALSFTAVFYVENYLLSLLIGFVLLIVLTYSLYEIVGRHYQKKGSKENVQL